MSAFETLIADHRKVAELFSQAEATEDEKQKHRLYQQINTELETHTQIEETVLYPALQKYEALADMVSEAIEEHRQIKTLMRESERLSDGSTKLEAKLKVMKEDVEHHVKEEEKELFPKAQKILSTQEVKKLEEAIEAARKKLRQAAPAR